MPKFEIKAQRNKHFANKNTMILVVSTKDSKEEMMMRNGENPMM